MEEERRLEDCQWRKDMETKVSALQAGQASIQSTLAKNNEMTEALLAIFNGMQSFWHFCGKVSRCLMWVATKGTIIAAFIVGVYHAIDAMASHDIAATFTKWLKK